MLNFRKLKEGLKCIEDYASRNLAAEAQTKFTQIYGGSMGVIKELCEAGPFQAGEPLMVFFSNYLMTIYQLTSLTLVAIVEIKLYCLSSNDCGLLTGWFYEKG